MKKNKNNKKYIWLISILIVIILGLIGFIVYDNFFEVDKTTYKNNSTTNTNVNEDNSIDKADNLYQKYLNNLKTNIKENYNNFNKNYKYIENEDTGLEYSLEIDKDFNLILSFSNEKLQQKYNNYILSENVLNMFLIQIGQSGFYNVYFLKTDGTLFSQCIDCLATENINLKQENYKNIVNIIQGGFDMEYSGVNGPIFIDIEGNIYTD